MPRLKEDFTQKKIGRLLVIGLTKKKKKSSGGHLWLCLCDCGNTTFAESAALRDNTKRRKRSCGCLNKDCKRKHLSDPQEAQINSVISSYKRHASVRNLEFLLEREDFITLSQYPCHYCGVEFSNTSRPNYESGYGVPWSYSGIDRIDSARGYDLTNCVPCCATCNIAKNDSSYEDFLALVARITAHREKYYKGVIGS